MEFNIQTSVGEIRVLHIDDYEDKPTIVFLHDSLGCIELWRDFPAKLGELTQCNVLVYDRQGYGKSCPFSCVKRSNDYLEIETDIFKEVLDRCNLDKVVLFGHSDGGTIALLYAAKYSQNLLGIITEGAHIFVEEVTVNGIKEAVESYYTTNLKSKLEKYHSDKTDDMFWAWAKTWTSAEFSTWNIEHFLPKITCPVLVIQGENDEYGTIKQVDGIITQVLGRAEKLIVPNAKHTPHKEVPDYLLAEVSNFIQNIV